MINNIIDLGESGYMHYSQKLVGLKINIAYQVDINTINSNDMLDIIFKWYTPRIKNILSVDDEAVTWNKDSLLYNSFLKDLENILLVTTIKRKLLIQQFKNILTIDEKRGHNNIELEDELLSVTFLDLLISQSIENNNNSKKILLKDKVISEVAQSPLYFLFQIIVIVILLFIACILADTSYSRKNKKGSRRAISASKASVEVEKKLGNAEDIIRIGLLMGAIFAGWTNQLLCTKFLFLLPKIDVITFCSSIYSCLLILNTGSWLYPLGSRIAGYLKGSSGRKYMTVDLVSDSVFLLCFFCRATVQNVRITLLFIWYYGYANGVDETVGMFLPLNPSNRFVLNPSSMGFETLYLFFISIIHLGYEVAHILLALGSQAYSLTSLTFWVINILYFFYDTPKSERFISITRREYRKKLGLD